MDYNIAEIQSVAEFRSRSNTWPKQRLDNRVQSSDRKDIANGQETKKSAIRRNAWGNLSYADLITQAITSSPNQRLTLSQIYEWMIQNIPYFRGRGDHNSSAGWKNSIRHNLSLHSKFLRVPNEGTGKSSWWTMNPEAKAKPGRRRAETMESGKMESRRLRAKKRAEILKKTCIENTANWDVHHCTRPIAAFHLSPAFRARTYSSSSSCGLSPIPSEDMAMTSNWPSHRAEMEVENYCEELANNLRYGMHVKAEPVALYPSYIESIKLESISPPPIPSTMLDDTATSNLNGQYFINIGRPSLSSSVISQDLPDTKAIEDIHISVDSFQAPFECNVDELIKHELNIDGTLDFT